MLKLDLPVFKPKTKKIGFKVLIYDMIRKRYVRLTPEELVRQSIISYLVNEKKYPSSLMSVESAFYYNNRFYRSDIIVYLRNGDPYLLVECKTFRQTLPKDSFAQGLMYNRYIKSKYLLISNGIEHYGYYMSDDLKYSEITTLPGYPNSDI